MNDEKGVEQGFTLTASPSAPNSQFPISQIDLALSTNLTPHLADNANSIEFITAPVYTVYLPLVLRGYPWCAFTKQI